MSDGIVKVCKTHGNLPQTEISVRLRKNGRKEIICKICVREYRKKDRLRNPEKYKAHREKYRFLERDPETELLSCSRCKETKSVLEFNASMLSIRYPYCRKCSREATKTHHDKPESKEKHRQWYNRQYRSQARHLHYMKNYGISLDQYNDMLNNQNGVCAICKGTQTPSGRNIDAYLAVDHCHKTGKFRGILCRNCNVGIGNLQESKEILLSALKYLEANEEL